MSARIHNNESCIIVLAGDFTLREIPVLRELKAPIIGADGGISHCLRIHISPDYCIGDFDSLKKEDFAWLEEFEKEYPDRIKHLPVMKDDTDAIAAVRWGIELGYSRFYIYGALGGLMDHSYANIQLLAFLKERNCSGMLFGSDGREAVSMLGDGEAITVAEHQRVSVFAFSKEAVVSIRNMKYNADKLTISQAFPIGVSNETMEAKGSILVHEGEVLIFEHR